MCAVGWKISHDGVRCHFHLATHVKPADRTTGGWWRWWLKLLMCLRMWDIEPLAHANVRWLGPRDEPGQPRDRVGHVQRVNASGNVWNLIYNKFLRSSLVICVRQCGQRSEPCLSLESLLHTVGAGATGMGRNSFVECSEWSKVTNWLNKAS